MLPVVRSWFESEWPAWYGQGGQGDAELDARAYACSDGPLGLVAFHDGRPCGFVALKAEPFPSHPHLFPWAGAAYVVPGLRRQGIGRQLLLALELEARGLGHSTIHCATATSASLLDRCGWTLLEHVMHDGERVAIYRKPL